MATVSQDARRWFNAELATRRQFPTRALQELSIGLLDDCQRRLESAALDGNDVSAALSELFHALHERRWHCTPTEWRTFLRACHEHPLCGLLHQDPFTARAFHKPRGYAGDAVMMDYIYAEEEGWPIPDCSPLGKQIFQYTTMAPASEGVRARRGYIAELIDRFAEERPYPEVLTIAAGHLREAQLSSAIRRRRLGRFVALDADAESLEEVHRCYGRFGIETIAARFGKILTGRLEIGRFDLIYSMGLFDYLQQATASRLVRTMFELLRPGGRLVVANFLPAIRDVGYMEAFMDWHLIYRTRQDMIEITMEIPQVAIQEISLIAEENQNIIFLQVMRGR